MDIKESVMLGRLTMPGFIHDRPDGVYVDLAVMDSNELFRAFLDHVVGSGMRFQDGDYALLQKLAFLMMPDQIGAWADRLAGFKKPTALLLAGSIVAFPDDRRLMYRGWGKPAIGQSAGADAVEYFFEPIFVEHEVEVPVFDTSQPGMEMELLRVDRQTVTERISLDLDEFFASAWLAGVRFGWDIDQIKQVIDTDRSGGKLGGKIVVATSMLPKQGVDASLEEQSKSMHRNDAPKMLRDGRVDLTQFANRFPQVSTGTRLMRKIPRQLGDSGWALDGKELYPDVPHDYELRDLAGSGTRVENAADGQYIVAVQDGFLNIDAETHSISVTEKIINREGVSVRTTGNLSLQGDEFEEHGEVQERRTVEGMNMTFMADVFGNIVSRGGRITVRRHLAGGSARSPGGLVEIEGGASRADIEAIGGEVRIKFAESCRIVARKVVIERACLCDIVAEEADIQLLEGSALAACVARVVQSTPRKASEALIVVRYPELHATDEAILAAHHSVEEIDRQLPALTVRQKELMEQPDVKIYLHVQKKRAAGEITMNATQESQFVALGKKAAASLQQINAVGSAIKNLQHQRQSALSQEAALRQQRAERLAGLSCDIEPLQVRRW